MLQMERDARESDQAVQQCISLLASRVEAIQGERGQLELKLSQLQQHVEASYTHLQVYFFLIFFTYL